jgi:diguanylate cyclase (GGDEF)-like protein
MTKSTPGADLDATTATQAETVTESSPVPRSARRFRYLTRAAVLVPVTTFVALIVLWLVTLNLVRVERDVARRTALITSQELLDTYEAQVVRVLREIDQALKALQYGYRLRGDGPAALGDLQDRDLLPPELIFTVSVVDASGEVVAVNGQAAGPDVADRTFFERVQGVDALTEGQPVRSAEGWRLRFGRRLTAQDGSFGGIAVVEVDAAFFVSGYEASKLGSLGVLAVLGSDGVFRVRRTGDRVSTGGRVDYDSVVTEQGFGDTEAVLAVNSWDDVRRYTSARQLYDFPLAVVVGLAEEEHLAPAEERTMTYLSRAAAGSLLLVVVMAVLGRQGWKLEALQRREAEERVAHARRVEHLAYHDSLTGLPNRSFFGRLLTDHVRQAARYRKKFAVLFLDLDRFKQINDTLGHDAGDDLLREVAQRLEEALRKSDTVARMGGDEFVILLPDVESEGMVGLVARKVLAILKEPFILLGEKFTVTGSIGISLFPRDGADEQTLMKNADIAMYQAKEAGKNNFRYFSDEMTSASQEWLNLESSLRRALQNQEFDLHYQARRSLDTGRITGVEALLRWEHPDLGTVGPAKFLPLAEESGLILPIGRWVLRTACRQSVAWRLDGLPPLSMAVNLSARQFFDASLEDDVAEALRASGMPPGMLELEICESVLVRDTQKTVAILMALKKLGVQITVDNFGTGYSALSVLRQLPLDTIKIDRLFLREDDGNVVAREVTDAIIAMGHTLSSSVVVHGVETKAQADLLRKHACHQVQGFYFSRPVGAAEFTELLKVDPAVAVGNAGSG